MSDDGTIRLRVADDGLGLPSRFDPRTGGRMGLNFIFMIGEGQLGAVIEEKQEQGLAYKLSFKDNLYTARL
ncbi:MAG: hypothetical protein A3J97_03150 [Spirochaetes bacterium RIFOXYC1_FULL_54_7]|nr:MAG: hypothetical protein A3J97_03150 [Spirochaetes bacterium RIFOXYC1_FULL_54_7]